MIAAVGIGASASALAGPNLVVNGGFEQTNMPNGQTEISATNVTGWSSSGYNFIFGPGTAGTTGSYSPQFNTQVRMWTPEDGANNGFTAASPAGGNFVAADGAYDVGAITQTINGLKANDTYALTFYWAAAQAQSFTGPTTEAWKASLGAQTQETAVYQLPSHGFSGWMQQTFDFTATSASEVLSFLSVGTPQGLPPNSLLDGVSLVDVTPAPEPGSLALLALGLTGVAGLALRRRRV